MLAVINKIHWCVAVCAVHDVHANCYKLLHSWPAWPSNCWSHSTSHPFESQILVENRHFCLPNLHLTQLYRRGSPTDGTLSWRLAWKNLNGVATQQWKKCWRYIYSFRQNTRTWQTNGQTDGQTPRHGIGRAYARGKNHPHALRKATISLHRMSHTHRHWVNTVPLRSRHVESVSKRQMCYAQSSMTSTKHSNDEFMSNAS